MEESFFPQKEEAYPGLEALKQEAQAMCQYGLSHGHDVPPDAVMRLSAISALSEGQLNDANIKELAQIHQKLATIIEPATPQAVVIMKNKTGLGKFLGAVPLARRIIYTSLLFLAIFISVGQMSIINHDTIVQGILNLSGWSATFVIIYLIACSGLGACFAALHKLNRYIGNATYDPRYDSTYWTSIILGIIAGVFLSELLSEKLMDLSNTPGLGKPALAVLAGFSASMVNKILQRMVDSVESLFKGEQRDIEAAQAKAEQAKKKEADKRLNMDVARNLVDLETQFKNNPEQAQQALSEIISKLLDKR